MHAEDHLTTVVIPTLGRQSLETLLACLVVGSERPRCPVVVVDDRPRRLAEDDDLADRLGDLGLPDLQVVSSGGGGPARARNLGWRRARTPWVSFLDDDVEPDPDWYAALLGDLAAAGPDTAGSQGRLRVPLPEDRRPTDWERSTSGLATAAWITADMSYRREVLAAVGGFDERFPRAFREDADLALRVMALGHAIGQGERTLRHPVRPADRWVSLRQQAGNADDALMRRLHGRDWRTRARAPHGRRRRHVAVTAAATLAMGALVLRRRRTALAAAVAWSGGTAELAWARIAPGPRDREEVATMLLTSLPMPFLAVGHAVAGWWRHRHAGPWKGVPDLVLFDRDGTLVHDVPYNHDPDLVRPVAGAREAVDRLRSAGVKVGIVTNQSGVASGRITPAQLAAVHGRLESELGRFDLVSSCPHAPDEACECRKPAPGMVSDACARLGVSPDRCVVVGDIGSDVEAARGAGAVGVLVPTEATREAEVRASTHVAGSLGGAVDLILTGGW